MNDQEHLAQGEFYFSESEGRLLRIADLVPQHAYNAYKKLLGVYGDIFPESELAIALASRFIPDTATLRNQLAQFGKASIAAEIGPNTARSRLRRAGAKVTRQEGKFIVGYPDNQIKVSLRATRS
jgi:hypothetical protein